MEITLVLEDSRFIVDVEKWEVKKVKYSEQDTSSPVSYSDMAERDILTLTGVIKPEVKE